MLQRSGLYSAPATPSRVATVTAGIRGTDIWGKTEPERDFICLLEGRIGVSHQDGDAREMSEPLTFYVAPRGQPPKGIEKADPETVKQWAAETEIQAGAGALRRGRDAGGGAQGPAWPRSQGDAPGVFRLLRRAAGPRPATSARPAAAAGGPCATAGAPMG